MTAMTARDMVVQLDLESLGGCIQCALHLDVVPRRLWIADG